MPRRYGDFLPQRFRPSILTQQYVRMTYTAFPMCPISTRASIEVLKTRSMTIQFCVEGEQSNYNALLAFDIYTLAN